jgi:hypothetical protein
VTFADVARKLEGQAARMRVAPMRAAAMTAPLLAASVHEVFGHDPPLRALKEATQDERTMLGFTPNDPLVRTGGLRETWVPEYGEGPNGPIAGVGSDSKMAMWHEFGYFNVRANQFVPPRPAGWEGFQLAQTIAKKLWMNTVGWAIKG